MENSIEDIIANSDAESTGSSVEPLSNLAHLPMLMQDDIGEKGHLNLDVPSSPVVPALNKTDGVMYAESYDSDGPLFTQEIPEVLDIVPDTQDEQHSSLVKNNGPEDTQSEIIIPLLDLAKVSENFAGQSDLSAALKSTEHPIGYDGDDSQMTVDDRNLLENHFIDGSDTSSTTHEIIEISRQIYDKEANDGFSSDSNGKTSVIINGKTNSTLNDTCGSELSISLLKSASTNNKPSIIHSPYRKSTSKQSMIWKHFGFYKDGNEYNESHTICRLCRAKIRYPEKHGTGAMWSHLRSQHAELMKSTDDKSQQWLGSSSFQHIFGPFKRKRPSLNIAFTGNRHKKCNNDSDSTTDVDEDIIEDTMKESINIIKACTELSENMANTSVPVASASLTIGQPDEASHRLQLFGKQFLKKSEDLLENLQDIQCSQNKIREKLSCACQECNSSQKKLYYDDLKDMFQSVKLQLISLNKDIGKYERSNEKDYENVKKLKHFRAKLTQLVMVQKELHDPLGKLSQEVHLISEEKDADQISTEQCIDLNTQSNKMSNSPSKYKEICAPTSNIINLFTPMTTTNGRDQLRLEDIGIEDTNNTSSENHQYVPLPNIKEPQFIPSQRIDVPDMLSLNSSPDVTNRHRLAFKENWKQGTRQKACLGTMARNKAVRSAKKNSEKPMVKKLQERSVSFPGSTSHLKNLSTESTPESDEFSLSSLARSWKFVHIITRSEILEERDMCRAENGWTQSVTNDLLDW